MAYLTANKKKKPLIVDFWFNLNVFVLFVQITDLETKVDALKTPKPS